MVWGRSSPSPLQCTQLLQCPAVKEHWQLHSWYQRTAIRAGAPPNAFLFPQRTALYDRTAPASRDRELPQCYKTGLQVNSALKLKYQRKQVPKQNHTDSNPEPQVTCSPLPRMDFSATVAKQVSCPLTRILDSLSMQQVLTKFHWIEFFNSNNFSLGMGCHSG